MRYLKFTALGGLTAILLAGCSGLELGRAEQEKPGDQAFDKALYTGYIDLSKSEFDEGDYVDSDQFAKRASMTAKGSPVEPEEISARKLPEDNVGELSGARTRLMTALAQGAKEKAPDQAAQAQVMFDCWMQEQEENFQPEDIARCRAGFMDSMAKVDDSLKATPVAATRAPAPAPMAMKKTFVVYFPFDSSKVTPASEATIKEAIDAAKSSDAKRIAVFGYTDTSGTKSYNATLSEMRAEAVAAKMSGGGISEASLNIGAFGEELPAVPTGDGVKLEKNRRVVIEISN